MATINREPIGPLHEKIQVQLSKEDYLPLFEKSLKQYAKQANVPGFRKGHVPAGMVRKMYGQSVFVDQVLNSAGKELDTYLKNEKLKFFGQPMILNDEEPLKLDMNKPEDVTLNFEMGLMPEFEVNALGKNLTRYKVNVNDKMMEDELERLKRRFGKVESVEEVTSKENIIYCTFQQTSADGTAEEGAEKVEETILMDKLPEALQAQLMGRKTGDSLLIKPVDVATAEELPIFLKQSLKAAPDAGDQTFEMTITKIGLLEPHELNQELMSQVFPNELLDEETFRNRLREEIQKEFDRMSSEKLNNEIFETLVHETNMQFPTDFLKRWLREGQEQKKSAEEVESGYGEFEHGLRWQIISDKLIAENELMATYDEVRQHVQQQVLGYFGMEDADEAPWLEGYMDKMMKDEKTVNETFRRMTMDKLFAWLQTQFQIAEQEVSEEEFFKTPATHHHHH